MNFGNMFHNFIQRLGQLGHNVLQNVEHPMNIPQNVGHAAQSVQQNLGGPAKPVIKQLQRPVPAQHPIPVLNDQNNQISGALNPTPSSSFHPLILHLLSQVPRPPQSTLNEGIGMPYGDWGQTPQQYQQYQSFFNNHGGMI